MSCSVYMDATYLLSLVNDNNSSDILTIVVTYVKTIVVTEVKTIVVTEVNTIVVTKVKLIVVT